MAEPSSVAEQALKEVADQLTCAICLEDYKDPKLLQCFHVYCKECLEKLVLRDQHGMSLRCPSCRRATFLPSNSVSGLQPAFLIHRLFEIRDTLVTESKKVRGPQKTLCGKCRQRDPTSFCHDCGYYLCSVCTQRHEDWVELSTHKVISLDQLEGDVTQLVPLTKKVTYCSKHSSMELTLYCETCEELICRDCIIGAHRDHQYDLITDAYPRKTVVTDPLQPVKQQLGVVNEAIERLDTLQQQINTQPEGDATQFVPPSKALYCSKHQEVLKIYCETCEELICRDCTIRLHQDHLYDLVIDAYPKQKKVITDHLQPVKQQLGVVNETITSLDTRQQQISDQRMEIKANIEKTIQRLQEALEERKMELIDQLDQLTYHKMTSLAAPRDEFVLVQTRLSSCLDYVSESLRTGSQAVILAAKKPVVQLIKEMTAEFKPELFVPVEELADLKFTATAEFARACSHFGQVYVDPVSPVKCHAMSKGLEGKKASTQQSTDSRGYPPTTAKEGLFSPSYLRGVDKIINEIEFVLTDEAQSYEWMDGGFKLDTPHGALPAGAVPCQIDVKASLSGQFEFPENSELVSPIYWISTPKNLRFSRPLTVHVQHCGTVENKDDSDLSFVVAKCTQPDLPYKFRFLDGGLFVPDSSYGSISVTHFSGLGIVSKLRKDRSYCAHTYVTNSGRDDWKVYFVILRDLPIVLKAVDTHYSFAKRDATLRIDFEEKEISLDIGQITGEGWKILPQSHPSISKRDAKQFRSGQWIPACELIVWWERSGQRPVRLRHRVSLIGAKAPKNYFYIAINPEWEEPVSPPPLLQQMSPENTRQELCVRYPAGLQDRPELCDLMNEVAAKIPSKWRQFGIELRLTTSELDGFLVESLGDTLQCFSSVFTVWKDRMSREPYSWLTVVESLMAPAVRERRLALELKNKLTRTCHSLHSDV